VDAFGGQHDKNRNINSILITSREQEYFSKSVGQVKKVSLQYNQNGQSRGIADISFNKPGLAAKAAKELNGMLVDKRPMKASKILSALLDRHLTMIDRGGSRSWQCLGPPGQATVGACRVRQPKAPNQVRPTDAG
jgi:THO complex subunit 4